MRISTSRFDSLRGPANKGRPTGSTAELSPIEVLGQRGIRPPRPKAYRSLEIIVAEATDASTVFFFGRFIRRRRWGRHFVWQPPLNIAAVWLHIGRYNLNGSATPSWRETGTNWRARERANRIGLSPDPEAADMPALHDKEPTPMALIASAYLIAGLALVFVGPAAKGLRLELADLNDNPEATPIKRAAFAGAVALGIILLWPYLVPSAWRSLKPPTALEAATFLMAKALRDLDKEGN
jgi:hypothetical protein